MSESMKIEFPCSILQSSAAIKIGSDTMRVTLEIPLNNMGDAIALAALQGTPLRASLEVDEPCLTGPEQGDGKKQNDISKRRNGESRWKATEGAGADGVAGNGT